MEDPKKPFKSFTFMCANPKRYVTDVEKATGNFQNATPELPDERPMVLCTWEDWRDSHIIQALRSQEVSKCVCSWEVTDKGMKHIQGQITFKSTRRLTAFQKKGYGAHWEYTISKWNSEAYCVDRDFLIFPDQAARPGQGNRIDIKEAAQVIKDSGVRGLVDVAPEMIMKYPGGCQKLEFLSLKHRTDKPHVIWCYGETGAGKSHWAMTVDDPEELWVSATSLKWWDGYNQQKRIVFEEFRGSSCLFSELLRYLDKWRCNVPIKGGMVPLNSPEIYVTSCFPPSEVYSGIAEHEGSDSNRIKQLLRRIDEIWFFEITPSGFRKKTRVVDTGQPTSIQDFLEPQCSRNVALPEIIPSDRSTWPSHWLGSTKVPIVDLSTPTDEELVDFVGDIFPDEMEDFN